MIINDEKKMYTLNFDEKRRIMYETIKNGVWTKEDFKRFEGDYMKIKNILNEKPWSKFCDLRNYKVSGISEELTAFSGWMAENNLKAIATIVDNAVTLVQMNKAGVGKFAIKATLTEKEADEWLKSQGF